ncbi:MAG: hypothetical protein LH629_14880 [Ignavibacteria bacterium]|nr:hypothetical protein [Ignavibacteria bacterium]
MKTLVIHPEDETTDFLEAVYKDTDWSIDRGLYDKKELVQKIEDSDRIVMLGHGAPKGLFGYQSTVPARKAGVDDYEHYLRKMESMNYVINEFCADFLRWKETVFVWCYADEFVENNYLSGFYTGMIISEKCEASIMNVKCTKEQVEISNTMFADAVGKAIFRKDPLKIIRKYYDSENNPVIKFNKERIYYNKMITI